ncbi:MAG: DUF4365 domain-containing protein [Gemmataceae bacterium]|nr:DUF4365 domain-containing protein [Gemmataceae bacterium]
MLTPQHRQEALSRAYVQAIAGRCGMSVSTPFPDYGIDLSLHEITIVGNRRLETGVRLDIQAKATTRSNVSGTNLRYDLAVRDYEVLRFAEAGSHRILVILALPKSEEQWLSQTEEELILRRCAYWFSLRDWPATMNRKSIRLSVPRTNVFTVPALRAIVKRIRARGEA